MSYSCRDVANSGFRVLGAVAALGFASLLLYFGVDVYFGNISKGWPSTAGKITENTEISTTEGGYCELDENGNGGTRTWTSVRHQFHYRYSVDGREFTASRIAFAGYPDECDELRHANGDVPVFYDPEQPSRSVLHPGIYCSPTPLFATFFAGLAFSLVLAYTGVSSFERLFAGKYGNVRPEGPLRQ